MEIGKSYEDVRVRQAIDPSYRPKDRLLNDEEQMQVFVSLS